MTLHFRELHSHVYASLCQVCVGAFAAQHVSVSCAILSEHHAQVCSLCHSFVVDTASHDACFWRKAHIPS